MSEANTAGGVVEARCSSAVLRLARSRSARRRPGIDPVLAEIGALAAEVRALLLAVSDPDEAARQLGPLLFENHRLLQKIGVSTPALDGLVELARDAGATGAKLTVQAVHELGRRGGGCRGSIS